MLFEENYKLTKAKKLNKFQAQETHSKKTIKRYIIILFKTSNKKKHLKSTQRRKIYYTDRNKEGTRTPCLKQCKPENSKVIAIHL